MTQISMPQALDALRRQAASGAALPAGQLQELGEACVGLVTELCRTAQTTHDPRTALAFMSLVEQQFRACLRAQLAAVAAAEATGAHALCLEQYDALRAEGSDDALPPQYAAGRTVYKDTTALLEAWLGINHFEAEARVADTHRIQARRTSAGAAAAPRYRRLAALFGDPSRDPRPARDAGRKLEALEPAPGTAGTLGALPEPTAQAPDGRLLEDHAVDILLGQDEVTATKLLTDLCSNYKKVNTDAAKPELGIFRRRTVLGVDQYLVRVEGADAELMRSLMAQADNPRTRAGAAARLLGGQASPSDACPDDTTPDDACPEDATPDDCSAGDQAASDAMADAGCSEHQVPDPPWLTSTDPPPPWAADPEEPAVERQQDFEPCPAGPAEQPDGQDAARPEQTAATDAPSPAVDRLPTPAPQLADQPVPVPRRRLRAILALLKARATGSGTAKTITPQVVVYMQLEHLLDLAHARGISTHGVPVEGGHLRRLLCEAQLLPQVLNGQGQVLDVARTQRLFTPPQRQALLGRDRGCIIPGCTYPPELCEAHHWPEGGWAGGCGTSVREGTLLCPNEHDDYHAGKFRIVEVDGLPHVLMPPHLDPTQTPRRNQYWFSAEEQLARRRRSGEPPGCRSSQAGRFRGSAPAPAGP